MTMTHDELVAPAREAVSRVDVRTAADAFVAGWNHDNIFTAAGIDLAYFLEQDHPAPTSADVAVLTALLDVLDAAPPDTSPSKVEKLIASARVLPRQPGGHRPDTRRRIVLTTLALVGVLPQPSVPPRLDQWYTPGEELDAYTALGRSPYSDLMLPLAGWTSTHGIDRARVELVFGHLW